MNVLVVGASSSVGHAVVDAFDRATFGRNETRVLPTYSGHPVEHDRAAHLDLLDQASIEQFAAGPLTNLGPVDVGVLLAGVLPGTSLSDYVPSEMDRTMSVNVTGQAKLIQAMLPHLAERSLLLLMSSVSAERGSYDPIYAASKSALVGLARSLATQLAPKTRVNVVSPGLIEHSGMYEQMPPHRREHHRVLSPTGALLQLDDLARILVDLARPHWRHLNGAVISLNGGACV